MERRHLDGALPRREPAGGERFRPARPGGALPASGSSRGISRRPGSASASRPAPRRRWPKRSGGGSSSRDRTIPTSSTPKCCPAWRRRCCSTSRTRRIAVTFGSEQARTTCQAPGAVEACKLLAALAAWALSLGSRSQTLLVPPAGAAGCRRLALEARRDRDRRRCRLAEPQAGNVLEALDAAVWAFRIDRQLPGRRPESGESRRQLGRRRRGLWSARRRPLRGRRHSGHLAHQPRGEMT